MTGKKEIIIKEKIFTHLKAIFFLFALLSLLYTINSEIIIQNINHFPFVAYKSIFGMEEEEKSIEDFMAGKKRQGTPTYIFVIDISKSIARFSVKPSWYDGEVKRINKAIADSRNDFEIEQEPSAFEICKIKLCQLLLNLDEKDVNINIWTLGKNANEFYSSKDDEKAGRKINMKTLMKSIVRLEGNKDDDTDFFLLIDYLISHHNSFKDTGTGPFVLVIISDMIHDIKNQIISRVPQGEERRKFEIIAKNKKELHKKINEMAMADIFTNIIVLSDIFYSSRTRDSTGSNLFEVPIMKYLEDSFSSSRLDKFSISDENTDPLYTNILVKDSIKFYYSDPAYIPKSSFIFRITKPGKYKFGFPKMNDDPIYKKLVFKYQVLSSSGQEKKCDKCWGKLFAGAPFCTTPDLDAGDAIKLTYSGRYFPNIIFPELKIYFPKEDDQKAYIIPIDFKKKLPKLIAWIILILQILFVFYFIWMAKLLLPKIVMIFRVIFIYLSNTINK